MKKSKNILKLTLFLFAIMFVFNSCKKGEDDPFLSLRSRKSKVVGEWTIDTWKETSNFNNTSNFSSGTDTETGTTVLNINGNNLASSTSSTYVYSSGTSTQTSTMNGIAAASMTFENDGTFEKTIEYTNCNYSSTYTSSGSNSSSTSNVNQSIKVKGTWNFLGSVEEDYKNKERIILNIQQEITVYNSLDIEGNTNNQTITQTFANGENSEVWQLLSLKNKEMIIKGEFQNTNSENYTYTGSGYTNTGIENSSTIGSIEGTLIQ